MPYTTYMTHTTYGTYSTDGRGGFETRPYLGFSETANHIEFKAEIVVCSKVFGGRPPKTLEQTPLQNNRNALIFNVVSSFPGSPTGRF